MAQTVTAGMTHAQTRQPPKPFKQQGYGRIP